MEQEQARVVLVRVQVQAQVVLATVVQELVEQGPELVNKFPAAATALHNPHDPAPHARAVVQDDQNG